MRQKIQDVGDQYLKEELLLTAFEDSHPPVNFIFRDTVESTNTLARELAEAGEPEITAVWAEHQTQGRGRMGRQWFSEPHQNILMSLLLRPKVAKERLYGITAAMSLGTVMAIESMAGLKARVKWPNDVLISGKKIAGILTESSIRSNQVEYVICGIGLNVNWKPEGSEILYPTTSLFLETGKRFSREQMAIKLLKNFLILYELIREKRFSELLGKWANKADFFGKKVTISQDGRILEGIPVGMNPNGNLILVTSDNQRVSVSYGDLLPSPGK